MNEPTQAEDLKPTEAPPRVAGTDPVSIVLFLLVIAVVLGGDLWLKYWSFENVADVPVQMTPLVSSDPHLFWSDYRHEPTVVVGGVLNLQLTSNRGAVFGLGAGNRVAFIVVSVLATAVIGFLFWRSPAGAWPMHFALALILGGALGNLYDRVFYAVVRDMLHMLPGGDATVWAGLAGWFAGGLAVGV